MANILIAYHSFSGNTEEVAEAVKQVIENEHDVTLCEVGSGQYPNLASYDFIFLGTFTWEKGVVPDEMNYFLEDYDYPSGQTAVFGTGDTQFGGDALFCKAVDLIVNRLSIPFIPLKIEQRPIGSQMRKVKRWTESIVQANKGVFKDVVNC